MKKQPYYTPPMLDTPLKLMYKDFYDVADKIGYLKDNKEMLEKKYDINVIALINAYMNDDWPQKRERQLAN